MKWVNQVSSKVKKEKTEDADYDAERLNLKSFKIEDGDIVKCAKGISHGLGDVLGALQKMLSHVIEFSDEADAKSMEMLGDELDKVGRQIAAVRHVLDNNLRTNLQAYDGRVAEVHRLKELRCREMTTYDEAREFLRLTEGSKKSSASEIQRARDKAAAAKERYEGANQAFLDGVNVFTQERRGMLGWAFVEVMAATAQLGELLRDGQPVAVPPSGGGRAGVAKVPRGAEPALPFADARGRPVAQSEEDALPDIGNPFA